MSFQSIISPVDRLRTAAATYPQQPQFTSNLRRLAIVVINNDAVNDAFYSFSPFNGIELPIKPINFLIINSILTEDGIKRPTFALFVRGTIAAQDVRGYELVG